MTVTATTVFEMLVLGFLMGLSRPIFLYFRLFYILQLTDEYLPMSGFEPRVMGVTTLPTLPRPPPKCFFTSLRPRHNEAHLTPFSLPVHHITLVISFS